MQVKLNHPWHISQKQAIDLQSQLALRVIEEDLLKPVRLVAGVDVAYAKNEDCLVAAVVVLDCDSLKPVETIIEEDIPQFPYIPGLFSFRELPPIIKAFSRLKSAPDLVICDGHGIAHPRNFGLACHLGLIFDIPAIGCAKTRLIGQAKTPGRIRGSMSPLVYNDKVVGSLLRTQNDIKPVYVSIGHRISLPTACEWILRMSTKYRLPETTRAADRAVRAALKKPGLRKFTHY